MKEKESRERLKALQEYEQLKREAKLYFYKPYPKQKEFHAAGRLYKERALMAANRVGKTWSAGMEVAMHLTGIYPEWWDGKRFDRPTRWGFGSKTAELTRDGAQKVLLGSFTEFGTGTIPKANLIEHKLARGTPEAVEIIRVRHNSGGTSEAVAKAYADGREKWQADTWDGVWFDEEPPQDIYTEGLTRTNTTKGISLLTFTPLLGMSTVVIWFWDKKQRTKDRFLLGMTLKDAGHFDADDIEKMLLQYPPHERKARAEGIPLPGSGRVFPIAEELIVVDDFPIPEHWLELGGMDIGWDHPTAAVKLVIDPEKKCRYIVADYRATETTPILHTTALKPWGEMMPWAWPLDGLHHDKGSGEQVAQLYRKNGLKLVSEHAQFPDERGNGVEAGLWSMLELMQTGQWKVFKSCGLWLEEFRMYHRVVKDGKVEIMKLREDTISASRYAHMMERYARPKTRPEQKQDRYSKPRLKHAGAGWMSA